MAPVVLFPINPWNRVNTALPKMTKAATFTFPNSEFRCSIPASNFRMKSPLLAMSLATVAFLTPEAQDRSQTRSMVLSRDGIVASEHPLASQAGATVLAQGGHAVDAALAANAMMSVTAPMMCGPGGDLFALVYDAKTGQTFGLNASGWAPQALNAEYLRRLGHTNMPQSGIHSVTVPGAVDGWLALHRRFGKIGLKQVLAPAILAAEQGVPLTEWVAAYWKESEAKLRTNAECARVYLPQNRAPRVGEVFKNPDLARTYQRIAKSKRAGFYAGSTARAFLKLSRELKGTITSADLDAFTSEWVTPISTDYRGWTVQEIPPGGQGIAALLMLNIMETFPLKGYGAGSADTIHTIIEAKKLAYADLLQYIADPRQAKVPTTHLLSKAYAHARAKLIHPSRAMTGPEPGRPSHPGTDTTYLCAVDAEGNMVSWIQSIYSGFGSALVPEGTGVLLHNRAGLFSLESGHPNELAGRKRPLHTIIPAMMIKDSRRIAFGIMGGFNQAQAHAQFVSHIADFGLNIQEALEAPRFTKLTFAGRDIRIEDRVPAAVREELKRRGHELQVQGPFSSVVGGGQAVMRDESTGVNYGASDPRKDGAALPQPFWTRQSSAASPRKR